MNSYIHYILFCYMVIKAGTLCVKKEKNLSIYVMVSLCVDSDVDVKDLNSGYANISLTDILPKIVSTQETLPIQILYNKLTLLVPF